MSLLIIVKQVDNIITTLKKHHIKLAYELSPNDGKIGYMLSMMMIKDELLSLIDFERAWPVGFEQEGNINEALTSSFAYHNDTKFKSMLKETIITANREDPPKGKYEEK